MKDIQKELEYARQHVQMLEDLAALRARRDELERTLFGAAETVIYPLGPMEPENIMVRGWIAPDHVSFVQDGAPVWKGIKDVLAGAEQ